MLRQPVGNHASDLVITSSRKDQAVGPVVLTLIIAALVSAIALLLLRSPETVTLTADQTITLMPSWGP
jgi:hypothetical protein